MTSQMKSMRTLTREWLILPDQYDRFTRYLRDNGLTTATRLLLGIIVIGLGVCSLLNQVQPVRVRRVRLHCSSTLSSQIACFVGR